MMNQILRTVIGYLNGQGGANLPTRDYLACVAGVEGEGKGKKRAREVSLKTN